MHTNVIILKTLFGISQERYYIFIAGHNKSSTTLHRSMTSSTQALSLLCEMLACLLVQCPSKFLSPLRIQFKVMQKNACSVVYLEKSFETVLVNVEEREYVKVVLVDKQWVLTSQGPFILLPCLVVFPESGVSFVPTRKSVMKYTHSNSAFSFSLYSLFLTLE